MHPVRKQRLILVSLMVVLSSAAIGLVAFALRDNINLFYPPADQHPVTDHKVVCYLRHGTFGALKG